MRLRYFVLLFLCCFFLASGMYVDRLPKGEGESKKSKFFDLYNNFTMNQCYALDPVECVGVCNNSRYLSIGYQDDILCVYDLKKENKLLYCYEHDAEIVQLLNVADTPFVISGDNNGHVFLHDILQKNVCFTHEYKEPILKIKYSEDLKCLVLLHSDHTCFVYDFVSKKLLFKLEHKHLMGKDSVEVEDLRYASAIELSDNGRYIAFGCDCGNLFVYDAVDNKKVKIKATDQLGSDFSFSKDSNYIVTSFYRTVKIIDVKKMFEASEQQEFFFTKENKNTVWWEHRLRGFAQFVLSYVNNYLAIADPSRVSIYSLVSKKLLGEFDLEHIQNDEEEQNGSSMIHFVEFCAKDNYLIVVGEKEIFEPNQALDQAQDDREVERVESFVKLFDIKNIISSSRNKKKRSKDVCEYTQIDISSPVFRMRKSPDDRYLSLVGCDLSVIDLTVKKQVFSYRLDLAPNLLTQFDNLSFEDALFSAFISGDITGLKNDMFLFVVKDKLHLLDICQKKKVQERKRGMYISHLPTDFEQEEIGIYNKCKLLNRLALVNCDDIFDISKDGRFVVVGFNDGILSVYNLDDIVPKIIYTHDGQMEFTFVKFSRDMQYLLVGHSDGQVRVHDLRSKKPYLEYIHEFPACMLRLSNNQKYIASAHFDGTCVVMVHDMETKQKLCEFSHEDHAALLEHFPLSLYFSNDDRYMLCPYICGIVMIYDFKKKQGIYIKVHKDNNEQGDAEEQPDVIYMRDAKFSHDEKYLIVCIENEFKIIDIEQAFKSSFRGKYEVLPEHENTVFWKDTYEKKLRMLRLSENRDIHTEYAAVLGNTSVIVYSVKTKEKVFEIKLKNNLDISDPREFIPIFVDFSKYKRWLVIIGKTGDELGFIKVFDLFTLFKTGGECRPLRTIYFNDIMHYRFFSRSRRFLSVVGEYFNLFDLEMGEHLFSYKLGLTSCMSARYTRDNNKLLLIAKKNIHSFKMSSHIYYEEKKARLRKKQDLFFQDNMKQCCRAICRKIDLEKPHTLKKYL